MKPYFLGLATLLVVGVGCAIDKANFTGDGLVDRGNYTAPPTALLQRPGPMVDGPGPGVIPMAYSEMAAIGATPNAPGMPQQTTQIRFVGPEAMTVGWQIGQNFADNQVTAPGRYNFVQGGVYRLKLTGIPDRDGLVLYPTLQVYPSHPHTEAYLSHTGVPLQLTDEDLEQIVSNNFVTKVVYLPDPQNQELAVAGVETLVSTRLDPGVDPIAEADRRGTIMAVLRCGNMQYESGDGMVPVPGKVDQTGHIVTVNGDNGQFAAPTPIGNVGSAGGGIPGPMMMGVPGLPGQGAVHPISGVGPTPVWGMTSSGTPIGLPGPPHLPYGGPAGLKSHTVRNKTKQVLPPPVDHMLVDVKQNPGIRMPRPVKHIQYTENHPQFRRPVVQEMPYTGTYCPPGQ